MAKGGDWERTFCHELSAWWAPGRGDVFWRTANSGGRATARAKKGATTFGQHGDVGAIDPCGLPFLKLFAVELKRGYSSKTPFDLVDRPKPRKGKAPTEQTWEGWLRKATGVAAAADARWWLIVARRDGRTAVAAFPTAATEELFGPLRPKDWLMLSTKVDGAKIEATAVPREWFFDNLTPARVRLLAETTDGRNRR